MSGSAFEPRLCKHLDRLVSLLGTTAPKALNDFDPDAIHKARVTTRRLKAAIELVEPGLEKGTSKAIARLGRKLRRRLGPLRDIDVMLGHLDEIKPTVRFGPAVDWFRQRLLEQRETAREESRKITPAKVSDRLQSWPMLRQGIVNSKDSIDSLLSQSVHQRLDQFRQQAAQFDASDPHALRIAGKALRYTLELAKAQGHELPAQVLRSFKRMQDYLGLWHDHVVLAERVMQACIDSDLPLHDPQTQRHVLGLVDHAMKRAQQQLQRFGALWKERGDELSQAIHRTIPPSAPTAIIEPKTDPDPAPTPPPAAPEAAYEAPPPPS